MSNLLHTGESMTTKPTTDARTRWGRIKFAGGRVPAMAIAIPAGLVLAVAAGALTLLTQVSEGEHALVVAGVTALVMSWGLIGLTWALVVDRASLQGAIDNPEESIESKWLDTAMAGALRDTIMLTGFALATLAITGFDIDALWALVGVILIAFSSTLVRYLMAKKRS
ncbi:hypothetical protein [Microbacterium suaedae]|uniref:hypothetical protein n=2 Tax=Microbacterium suaedae TaxID=2067813 RepID=UPI001E5AB9DF|nr:hypothetical protein [Microbacterium suaedae]